MPLHGFRNQSFLNQDGIVIINGLTISLDAGNQLSYPGSGSTWFDLSGNGYSASVPSSSVIYQTNNKGMFFFTGASPSVVIGIPNSVSVANGLFADGVGSFSVSIWYKWVSSPTPGTGAVSNMILGKSGGIGVQATFGIFGAISSYDNGAGGASVQYGNAAMVSRGRITVIADSINDNLWHNTAFVWNSSASVGKIYHDGIFIKNANIGTAAFQTNDIAIGNRNAATPIDTHSFNGSFSNLLIYNRAISDAEVEQNFNAIRGRYLS